MNEVKQDFDFFKTIMPDNRQSDFYLGCLDGSVFMDFNQTATGFISLCRISFDGYGCCDIADKANYLNHEMSKQFIHEIEKIKLDQGKLTLLIKEVIRLNKEHIWTDALKEFSLLD